LTGTASGNECGAGGFSNCSFNGSPSIIKFGESGTLAVLDKNTNFPSIDGSEFQFTNLGTNNQSGTWTYTPGAGDPGITAFIVFAGNVQNQYTGSGLTGSWTTPSNKDLSHITFFDTAIVPLPAALPLLGTGLLGLWGIGRMRRNIDEGSAAAA